jgi:hypothetical protein
MNRDGFDIYILFSNELVGDDPNTNFIPLSVFQEVAPDASKIICQHYRVYGLKPERIPLSTAEGLNNSVNNMDLFFQQFTIMLKAMKNTNHWNMVNYRRLQSIMRLPFKYFTYHTPDVAPATDPQFLSGVASFSPDYFDKRDIPDGHAMRFETINETIKHDIRTGTKIMEIKIQSYKPLRQISVTEQL